MCDVGNDWEACSRATVVKRREIVIPSLIPRRAARLLRNAQEVFALLAQSHNTHPLYVLVAPSSSSLIMNVLWQLPARRMFSHRTVLVFDRYV